MNAFEQATTLLLEALSKRPPGSIGRVSIASLERLTEAAGVAPRRAAAPAKPATARETSPMQTPGPTSSPEAPRLSRLRTEPTETPRSAPAPAHEPIEDLAARVRAAMSATRPPSTPAAPPAAPHVGVEVDAGARSVDPAEQEEAMNRLRERVLVSLAREPLARHCDRFVFGAGNAAAELMFVGEAPGAEEEATGEPFVGKSGELLTKIIEAMGLKRGEIYLANVLKWRPEVGEGETGNRKPRRDEIDACLPYLKAQIEIIRPKCLVTLGETATQALTGSNEGIGSLRGQWHAFEGIPLMATYHPAHLLRNQTLGEKRKVWEDLLQVMKQLGLPISAKQRGYFLPR